MNAGRYTTLGLDGTAGATRTDPTDSNSNCPSLIQAAILAMGGDFAQPPPAQAPAPGPAPGGRRMFGMSASAAAAITKRANGVTLAHAFSVSTGGPSQMAYQAPRATVRVMPQRFADNTTAPPTDTPPPVAANSPPLSNTATQAIEPVRQEHKTQMTIIYAILGCAGFTALAVIGYSIAMVVTRYYEKKVKEAREKALAAAAGKSASADPNTYRMGGNFAPKLVWSSAKP